MEGCAQGHCRRNRGIPPDLKKPPFFECDISCYQSHEVIIHLRVRAELRKAFHSRLSSGHASTPDSVEGLQYTRVSLRENLRRFSRGDSLQERVTALGRISRLGGVEPWGRKNVTVLARDLGRDPKLALIQGTHLIVTAADEVSVWDLDRGHVLCRMKGNPGVWHLTAACPYQ